MPSVRGRLKTNFQINRMVRVIVIDRVITALWAFYGVSAMFLNVGLAPWVREAKERLQRRMVNVMQQRVVGIRCFVAEWTCAVTLINRVLCAWSNQHVNCQGGRSSLTRILLNLLERIEWTFFFFECSTLGFSELRLLRLHRIFKHGIFKLRND